MSGIIESVKTFADDFHHVLYEKGDPRVQDWLLMQSPLPVILILVVFFHFIKYSGPQFMEKRKPYEIKNIMIVYNAFQCIVNAWATLQGLKIMLHPEFNFRCNPVSFEDTTFNMKISYLGYIYFWVKIADLTDTVFMVLRKNYRQITFLHVYHHIGMVMGTWIVLKYLPSAHMAWVGFLNCFVHTVMYFYYLLTAYSSEVKKSIWWKKHITELQMVQFFLILAHHGLTLLNSNCNYPKSALMIFISQNFLIFYLFAKFYYDNYIRPKKSKNE